LCVGVRSLADATEQLGFRAFFTVLIFKLSELTPDLSRKQKALFILKALVAQIASFMCMMVYTSSARFVSDM